MLSQICKHLKKSEHYEKMKTWKKKKKKETYKETVIKNPKGFPKSLAQKFHFHSSNLLKHKNTKNILGFPFPEL